MRTDCSQGSVRGISLIEVLSVTIIVAVVAAVLFPVFAHVRESGGPYRSCVSNEKQLGLAFLEYSQDNNERFPNGTLPSSLHSIPMGWAGQIYPYLKAVRAYKCPDDPTVPGSTKPYLVPVSYAYNWNAGAMAPSSLHGPTSNAALPPLLASPGRTVLLCEAIGTTADIAGSHGIEMSSPAVLGGRLTISTSKFQYATGVLRNDPESSAIVGTENGDALATTGVHNGSSNFLFVDGHAKCLEPNAVSAGLNNPLGASDCTAGQGLKPIGKAGNGYAAGTACADPALQATFSIY